MKVTPFVKGNKLGKGRPKGVKNREDLNGLRKLMETVRHEDRIVILNRLRSMAAATSDTTDFKWLINVMVELEPKNIKADVNVTYTAEDLLERFDRAVLSQN